MFFNKIWIKTSQNVSEMCRCSSLVDWDFRHTQLLMCDCSIMRVLWVMMMLGVMYPVTQRSSKYQINTYGNVSYIISYHIIYHIISYHIISYHTIPYHTISYHIISLSYHIISYTLLTTYSELSERLIGVLSYCNSTIIKTWQNKALSAIVATRNEISCRVGIFADFLITGKDSVCLLCYLSIKRQYKLCNRHATVIRQWRARVRVRKCYL